MLLRDLLQRLPKKSICGNVEKEITKVCCDSREVVPGSLFVCIKGAHTDGHLFIQEAVKAGAAAVVVQEDAVLEELPGTEEESVTRIRVPSARPALAQLSAAFFGYPANYLTTIGITGTKGKTTTAYLIRSILERAGMRVGLIGTIETIIGEEHILSVNTTPESCLLQEYLYRMVEAGMDAVVMEVSSQGLKLDRTGGFVFDYGIFTNLGEDHIGPNEHADMEEYVACKSLLFQNCRVGIVNCDDPMWQEVTKKHTCTIVTYGFSKEADFKAYDTGLLHEDGALSVTFRVKDTLFRTAMPGQFSVYNGLAAIALGTAFGVEPAVIAQALCQVKIPGRMETVRVPGEYTLLIDYAHNAMSLKSLLLTLREYEPHRLICLFGCGGNRSKLRRIEMGRVSGELADFTIVTSDNPRFEEPQDIIEDIIKGMEPTGGSYIAICDRREAIAYAIEHAEPGDILVLAGKGHETYQEIKGERFPMNERELVAQILGKEGT